MNTPPLAGRRFSIRLAWRIPLIRGMKACRPRVDVSRCERDRIGLDFWGRRQASIGLASFGRPTPAMKSRHRRHFPSIPQPISFVMSTVSMESVNLAKAFSILRHVNGHIHRQKLTTVLDRIYELRTGHKSWRVAVGPERGLQAAQPARLFRKVLQALGLGLAPAKPCAFLQRSARSPLPSSRSSKIRARKGKA